MTMIDDAHAWTQPATPSPRPTRAQLLEDLDRFRTGLYSCLPRRGDALFELAEAVLSGTGPVRDLAHLCLEEPYRRGHGALYDALNAGTVDTVGLRGLLAGLPLPRFETPAGGRIVLAVDVSNWLRPDAATSPQRLFCHTYPRGRGQAQMIPGWPYSFVAALEPGATSWTTILDVTRLGPSDESTVVTATQLRGVIERLITAGQWQPGDPEILIVGDAGYDGPRLAWLLGDLPVIVVVRVRSDRVFHAPAGTRTGDTKGRPPRHGARLVLKDQTTWPSPARATTNTTGRYGTAHAVSHDRMHPRLAARSGWTDHQGDLPIIEGTLIQLTVEHLPGDRDPKPMWLWVSTTGATSQQVDHYWSMYLRRFDLEHTFRFLKQTLGWTRPRLRDPQAADRWTWLIIAAHTQLCLARPLAADYRLPWQRPLAPTALTPARVRAGYRRIHTTVARPSRPPKPSYAGPGRPKGRRNRSRAPIQPVGKG